MIAIQFGWRAPWVDHRRLRQWLFMTEISSHKTGERFVDLGLLGFVLHAERWPGSLGLVLEFKVVA